MHAYSTKGEATVCQSLGTTVPHTPHSAAATFLSHMAARTLTFHAVLSLTPAASTVQLTSAQQGSTNISKESGKSWAANPLKRTFKSIDIGPQVDGPVAHQSADHFLPLTL
jgi:hypothetical protein